MFEGHSADTHAGKISASVDGGSSGGSCVRRPLSKYPPQYQRKFWSECHCADRSTTIFIPHFMEYNRPAPEYNCLAHPPLLKPQKGMSQGFETLHGLLTDKNIRIPLKNNFRNPPTPSINPILTERKGKKRCYLSTCTSWLYTYLMSAQLVCPKACLYQTCLSYSSFLQDHVCTKL